MSIGLIVLILVVLLVCGSGGWGYSRGGWEGPGPAGGLIGLVLLICLILFLLGHF